ncbi:unnamed protein product, partial [Meganyctiphanes norvegica]
MEIDKNSALRNCLYEKPYTIAPNLTGTIPPWLRGSYILNGPGRMKYGDSEFNHVFDGSALLQKFTFSEIGITYSSKFLRSFAYTSNSENESIVVSEFGTCGKSAAKGKMAKLGEKFAFDRLFSDNAPIALEKYGGDWYAVTEAPFLHKIDPTTLETISKVDLHKELNINSQCPHPHLMPDGSSYTILHAVGATGPKYDIVKIPPKPLDGKSNVFAKPEKVASVDARWKMNPCHMHSFGVTEKHIVILEQPLTIDVMAMVANTVKEKPFIGGMEWKENKLVKIHLVNRETGKQVKQKIKCEAFFYMHIVNAYEKDNHLVIDLNAYEKADLLHAFYLKNLRENGKSLASSLDVGAVKRIVIPMDVNDKAAPEMNQVMLAGSKAKAFRQKDGDLILTPEILHNMSLEIPAMNQNYAGKKYQYFWGAHGDLHKAQGKVGKLNVDTQEIKMWGEDGLYASVVQFVPRPGATAEDDGVVTVSCLHGGTNSRNKVTAVILNGADLTEIARSTFTAPSDTPRSLHGTFLPA